ncbi:MAG: nitric oxide reductase activation protein [Magnetococcales bacterium]|nr:nitric oxide reductase activation protein [Magnetococcales bacterium]
MNVDQLEERLDTILEAALSSRRTTSIPAQRLARLAPEQQEQLLKWLAVTANLNPELAFQCATRGPDLLAEADQQVMAQWFCSTLARYDQEGLRGTLDYLNGAGSSLPGALSDQGALTLAEERTSLEHFIMGLGGRHLTLEEGEAPATDSEVIILPARLHRFPRIEQNRLLYQSMAALQWAFGRFGSFPSTLAEKLLEHGDGEQAAACYNTLESCRLDALLTRLLPGLSRRGAALWSHTSKPWPPVWHAARMDLSRTEARAMDALCWLPKVLTSPPPEPLAHHGVLHWQRALETRTRRMEREKRLFRQAVGEVLQRQPDIVLPNGTVDPDRLRIDLPDNLVCQIRLDGQRLVLPEDMDVLSRSIVQDLGAIPLEYLQPAGPGGYPASGGAQALDANPWQGVYHEEGAMLFDEWDHKRNDYRKGWCVLRELSLPEDRTAFVEETNQKYGGLIHHIRRSFEMIRGSDRRVRRQERGDEPDLDALIEAQVTLRLGQEMENRLFERMDRVDRRVATLILADMSGSTKGWVNDAIRESLILLSRALVILDDRFAIYGFSGNTRKQCEFYRVKAFTDPMDAAAYRRIAAIAPKDYTRMGVFIRRAIDILKTQEARSRLLITISDGRPEDYDSFLDGYRGPYGLADTRKALVEARRAGIHPFGITIDREAKEYLPHLYGPARFVVIDSARALPRKISDIYRNLTT